MTSAELRSLGSNDAKLAAEFERLYGLSVEITDDTRRAQVYDAVARKWYEPDEPTP